MVIFDSESNLVEDVQVGEGRLFECCSSTFGWESDWGLNIEDDDRFSLSFIIWNQSSAVWLIVVVFDGGVVILLVVGGGAIGFNWNPNGSLIGVSEVIESTFGFYFDVSGLAWYIVGDAGTVDEEDGDFLSLRLYWIRFCPNLK